MLRLLKLSVLHRMENPQALPGNNVALTRAKYQLFFVGDSNTLLNAGAQTITKLVNDAKCRGLLCDQNALKA
eukprot:scaffold189_cov244-Chaetoceros_neogracile.AAC.3